MSLTLEELEQRAALLSEALETIIKIDEVKGNPLTASAGARGAVGDNMVARMATASGRAQPSPTAGRSASSANIVAAVAGGNTVAGAPLTDPMQLAELMADRLRSMTAERHSMPMREVVAQQRWEYPPERQLSEKDSTTNTAKLDAVCGINAGRFDASGALVATGGVCLPVNVDYSVPTWSTADRPLRDSLPAFQATRGGVRFVSPPDIGVPSLQAAASGAGLSVTVWTEATDANPAGATKPVWTVACGAEQLVYVNAIPTRVQFGNMESRFAPEQVAANTQQAIAVTARQAELELLTLMYNSSKQVIPQQYLGAARDILTSADLLKAQYCDSHRIPRSTSFTAVFPAWAKDVIRADLAREVAHDNAGSIDVLAITDAQIDTYFSARGINPVWTLDALEAGTYGTGGSALPAQYFSLMATNAPHPQWPGQSASATFTLGWLLYVEGTYQFLDGGRLDLGVVRDSLLDSTNDYETFTETFEGVAFRGLEAYQVQSLIKPTGGSAGTVAATSYLE